MKKILLVLAIASLGISVNAQEQSKTTVIKINPLGLLFGSANIAYEKAINAKSSFLIAPQYGGFKLGGVKYSSFGGGAQYRFYLSDSKSAPAGFWAGPGVSFSSGKVKYGQDYDNDGKEDESKFTAFGGNAMIGNQWIFKSGFVIDLGGGISYQKFNYKDNTTTNISLKASGILPALSFSIGYNF